MMKQKTWAAFTPFGSGFQIIDARAGFPEVLAEHLRLHPPQIDGDTALARFYASGLDEQHGVELMPMTESTYTTATFEKHIFGAGINSRVVIVGWYW